MKKLLASDLDGTLIHNGQISDINKKSILKLRSKNNFFGVSTGRPYNGVAFLKEELNIDIDFYVLLNGALVLDKNLKVLKHEKIQFNILKQIVEKYKDCNLLGIDTGFETTILIGTCNYCWENTKYDHIDNIYGKECSLISIDLSNRDINEIYKVEQEINNEFSDYVVAYRNYTYIDIVPKGCSKGLGLKTAIENFDVSIDDVYVIGDSFNDVEMFKITKNSFTFPGVEEKLKEYTNFIVDSVSQCIEDYVLK